MRVVLPRALIGLGLIAALVTGISAYARAQQPTAPPFGPFAPVQVEFTGAVQSVAPAGFVINGLFINAPPDQVRTLAPGIVVRVRATWGESSILGAQEIALVPAGLLPGIVELTGTLSNISTDFIILSSGLSGTGGQIIGTGGIRAGLENAQIGQTVRVYAVAAGQGQWVARAVVPVETALSPAITPEVLPQPAFPTLLPAAPPPSATVEVVPEDRRGRGSSDDDDSGRNRGRGGGDDDND